MDVIGRTKIFRKDFNGKPAYSRAISSQEYKDGQKGDWISEWESVQFPKGTDIPDRSIVEIKGFEAVYKSKEQIKRKLVVREYKVLDEGHAPEGGYTALDEDIPF
ncbi:MAG: hypothetical protein IKO36_01460 [Bacteroidaceae bacterium]|nr:hypothetical protein [Bacteroidaceae bacterium]